MGQKEVHELVDSVLGRLNISPGSMPEGVEVHEDEDGANIC